MSVPIVISANADFICEAVRLALSCFGQVLQIFVPELRIEGIL
jgi:hypothetical protein